MGGVIPQRGFGDVTSRTYLSKLETGKSSITLDKLDQLSERLELSPLPLLTLTPSKSTGQPAQ
nr:helix-turn-helix transcriptional regulator [Pseudomonas chlororaphis]